MKYRNLFFGLLAGVLVVFCANQKIQAQEGSPEFQTAKQHYLSTLETYRTKEQQFSVVREQYIQIQTLASLEEAVKASKDVQLARIQTLHAYFETLYLYLSEIKGAEVNRKAGQLLLVKSVLDDLDVQQKSVEKAGDRITLDSASAQLESRQKQYIAVTASTLSLGKIATMQAATDQLGILSSQVFDGIQVASPAATVLAEKQRGYDELTRTIDAIKLVIAQTTKQFDTYMQGGDFSLNSYLQVTDTLNSGYTKLNQAENFLKELAR